WLWPVQRQYTRPFRVSSECPGWVGTTCSRCLPKTATNRKSRRSPREIIEFHLALASDFDRAASFELKRLAQRALGIFRHLYLARAAERFHSRSSIHGVAPNVIEQLARADHASHRRAGMNSDPHSYILAQFAAQLTHHVQNL